MQAITVRFLPATNYKPARYKALAQAGSVTISNDYSGKAPRLAALALCTKYGWEGDLIEGGDHDGNYVYLFVGSDRVSNPTVHPKRQEAT